MLVNIQIGCASSRPCRHRCPGRARALINHMYTCLAFATRNYCHPNCARPLSSLLFTSCAITLHREALGQRCRCATDSCQTGYCESFHRNHGNACLPRARTRRASAIIITPLLGNAIYISRTEQSDGCSATRGSRRRLAPAGRGIARKNRRRRCGATGASIRGLCNETWSFTNVFSITARVSRSRWTFKALSCAAALPLWANGTIR